jgi:hypothetical protein
MKLGVVEQTKERYRERRSLSWLDTLVVDLRFGARMLRKNPGFTAVAVLTLALGIGANTAVFTVINTILLHPLPYPQSERIVNVLRQDNGFVSIPMFTDWLENNSSFDDLAGYETGPTNVNLAGGDKPDVIRGIRVSQNYFHLFGAMARKFWPNQNPVGQTILIGAQLGPALEQGPTEIVGVVGDVHTKLESAASPTMYQLHSQVSDAAMKGERATSSRHHRAKHSRSRAHDHEQERPERIVGRKYRIACDRRANHGATQLAFNGAPELQCASTEPVCRYRPAVDGGGHLRRHVL